MTSRYEAGSYEPYQISVERKEKQEQLEQGFLEFTEGIRKSSIGVMPIGSNDVSHEGNLSIIESPFYDTPKPELLLTKDLYDLAVASGEGHLPDRFIFDFKKMMGIGKGSSRRMVSFGSGEFLWFQHQNMKLQVPMAVKQYDWFDLEDRRVMLHETVMYKHCAEKGVNTLGVLGIARFGTQAALLTHFEPGLTTLDNIEWKNQSLADEVFHLETAVDSLVNLHENLLFHGDAEFRNIPFGQRRGEAFAVDFERTVSLSGETGSVDIIERVATRIARDLRAISMSMVENELIPEPSPSNGYFEQFFQKFLLRYEHRICTGNSENKGLLLGAYSRVIDALVAELNGQPTEAIFAGLGRLALR